MDRGYIFLPPPPSVCVCVCIDRYTYISINIHIHVCLWHTHSFACIYILLYTWPSSLVFMLPWALGPRQHLLASTQTLSRDLSSDSGFRPSACSVCLSGPGKHGDLWTPNVSSFVFYVDSPGAFIQTSIDGMANCVTPLRRWCQLHCKRAWNATQNATVIC